MSNTVSIAEMKKNLSEYVAQSNYQKKRYIITKRSKPVAALVNLEDLKAIEQKEEKGGLLQVIGKWEDFDEITNILNDLDYLRKEGGDGRNVSL